MKWRSTLAATLIMALGIACGREPATPTSTSGARTYTYDFNSGPLGWAGEVAHYYSGTTTPAGLVVDYRPLPAPLDQTRSGIFISGDGGGGEFTGPFLYFKQHATGLISRATYDANFMVEIATDAPYGCPANGPDAGNPPGEATSVKAAASAVEPAPVLESHGWYGLNIDAGDTFREAGVSAIILGNMASTLKCESEAGTYVRRWELKTLASGSALRVQASADGSIWLLIGADSGYPGRTSLYVTKFTAALALVQ